MMGDLASKGGNGGTLFHQMLQEISVHCLSEYQFSAGVNFSKNMMEMILLLDSQQSENRQINPGFLSKLSKINKILCF